MYNATLKPTVDRVTGMKDFGMEKYSTLKDFGMDKVNRNILISVSHCSQPIDHRLLFCQIQRINTLL